MGCEVAGGGGGPAFDCNAALGNFARRKSLSICVSHSSAVSLFLIGDYARHC